MAFEKPSITLATGAGAVHYERNVSKRGVFDQPSGAVPTSNAEDVRERRDRARVVAHILERCEEELCRLELIPSAAADDVNTISAAKGFVARARAILGGRFQ